MPCSPPGLSLIFGVMRLVNIAHGDLIVLAAYIALVTVQALGINPLLSLVIVVPVMAAIGYGLQRALLNRTLGDDLLPPLLVTFGLSVIIQNGLLELFTADSVKLNAGAVEIESIAVGGGLAIGVLPLIQFALAVAVIAGLQWLFYRTALGRAFRATSDDQPVAQLMGLNNAHVFGLAMALSLAIVAVAGVLLAVRANFDPAIGPARLIFGFEAVIIGGLGSHVGHARRRHHSRRRAGHRRAARSGLESAGRPHRIPGRAGAPARGSVSQGGSRCHERHPRPALQLVEPDRHDDRRARVLRRSPPRRGGPSARTCGCSPKSTPMSRWRACGICSRAMPVSFRSGSRPTSGSAPICCSGSPCSRACIRSSPSRSPASPPPSFPCRSRR